MKIILTAGLVLSSLTFAAPPAEWEALAHRAIDDLGTGLLSMPAPRDAAKYCPRFRELSRAERKSFFTELLTAMARYESGFDPKATFTENFHDRKGRPVISRGLLQMSQESANAYGCRIARARQLHDVETNLRCGVRVLNRWITTDRVIGTKKRGGGRYWAVLRRPKQKRVQAITKALPFCRKRT